MAGMARTARLFYHIGTAGPDFTFDFAYDGQISRLRPRNHIFMIYLL